MANGEDPNHLTIPIRQSTVNEMLRELGEARKELVSTRTGIMTAFASLEGRLKEWMQNTDSDIKELKAAKGSTQASLTDLKLEAAAAEAIEAKAKWGAVVSFGVSILKGIALLSLGGLGKMLWDKLMSK